MLAWRTDALALNVDEPDRCDDAERCIDDADDRVPNDRCWELACLSEPLDVPPLFPPIAGAGLVFESCTLFGNLDPYNDGECDSLPSLITVSPEQEQACVQALTGSQVYQSECP